MSPLLSVQGLCKSYNRTVVLDDLNLEVDEHTCTVLIGASGSGKSTLLRCLNLLEVVDDGIVELDGEDITDPRVDANAVRSRVGIVFQSFNLFPHLRVLENVTLAPRRVHGVARAQAEEEALAMLERVGLREKAMAKPDELSGGQQQRVAIARALVNKPRLMLFDEVTSALDPELVGEVLSRRTRWALRATWPTPSASWTAAPSWSRGRLRRSSASRARHGPASSCGASSRRDGSEAGSPR